MENPPDMPWPHAPPHHLCLPGTYMVTAATQYKVHYFNTPEKLNLLNEHILKLAVEHKWHLQAWAVFSNHYHFIGQSSETPSTLGKFLYRLHYTTAKELNCLDNTLGRKVWYNFRDTNLTYHVSYLARLKYVHTNPVHHGLVKDARDYLWCSANWFSKYAKTSFRKSVLDFDTSTVNVYDEY